VHECSLEIPFTLERDGIGITQQPLCEYRRRLWTEVVPLLQPRFTRTTNSPTQTAAEIESPLAKNPRWGARVIHTKLVPACTPKPHVLSTIHLVLQRHGLVVTQQHPAPTQWKRFDRKAPSDLRPISGKMVSATGG